MRRLTDEEKRVFGEDAKLDEATGKPIEQGIGSALQQTASHRMALQLAESRKLAAGGDQASMAKVAEVLGALVKQLKDKEVF
jgi:hypothetical protein